MAISSLGVGNNILTQDVIDQLRKADEAQRVRPIELNLANENDKQDALKLIDSSMTNFVDSVNALSSALLWDERAATASGTSVEVSASSNTDVQDFTLDVTRLATKQIEQSGDFGASTDIIDVNAGSFDIQVGGGLPITINYLAGATLDDIKDLINTEAGSLVDATIVQTTVGTFNLFLSSDQTGDTATTDISISNVTNPLTLDNKLATGLTTVQGGLDSEFSFNGSAPITRSSNSIDDLIVGLTLTLKEANTGPSTVSIAQDRTSILEKFDSFVEKYNSNMTELDKMTKASTESDERGIFSSDSTIKGMKRAIQDMMDSIGGGVGSMIDYGFDIDQDGKMSLNKTVLEQKLDDEPINTQAFFSGGDYTNPTTSVVTTLTGVFSEMSTQIESYTKTNTILDQLKESFAQSITSLEERKTSATERLDAKYEIMKKQFAAYGLIISRINSASSMFVQLANAQSAAQN